MIMVLDERHFNLFVILGVLIVKVLRLLLTKHKLSRSFGVKIVGKWVFDIIHFIPCSTWHREYPSSLKHCFKFLLD